MERSSLQTVAPTGQCVTVAEMKTALGIGSGTEHDDRLTNLILAATQKVEKDTDSCLMTQTWTDTFESWYEEDDDEFTLAKGPVQSITSITYYSSANVQNTLDPTIYQLDKANQMVRRAYLKYWPVAAQRWDAITVTYVTGYASAAAVADELKHAVRLLVGHWFENPDMMINDNMYTLAAYRHLTLPYMRPTYP